ncbi:MAG TPA: hypothetical protein VF043_07870 [Ktedonobacteraceae bacterium]
MRLASQLSQVRYELRPLRRIIIPVWHNELRRYIFSAIDDYGMGNHAIILTCNIHYSATFGKMRAKFPGALGVTKAGTRFIAPF